MEFEPAAKAYLAAIDRLEERGAETKATKDFRIRGLLATIHRNCGVCLKQLGEFDDAHGHLTEALRLDPTDQQTQRELKDF
jgi:tetratricopeptide (TPR) repeat protein